MVMERVAGPSLGEWLTKPSRPPFTTQNATAMLNGLLDEALGNGSLTSKSTYLV